MFVSSKVGDGHEIRHRKNWLSNYTGQSSQQRDTTEQKCFADPWVCLWTAYTRTCSGCEWFRFVKRIENCWVGGARSEESFLSTGLYAGSRLRPVRWLTTQACTLAHDSGLYAGSRLRPVRWLATRALSYEATHQLLINLQTAMRQSSKTAIGPMSRCKGIEIVASDSCEK